MGATLPLFDTIASQREACGATAGDGPQVRIDGNQLAPQVALTPKQAHALALFRQYRAIPPVAQMLGVRVDTIRSVLRDVRTKYGFASVRQLLGPDEAKLFDDAHSNPDR